MYIYIYINWHSKLINIYIFTIGLLTKIYSTIPPFRRSNAVPWPPWPPGDSRGRDFAGLLPGKIILLGTKERGGSGFNMLKNCAFFKSVENSEDIKIYEDKRVTMKNCQLCLF